MSVLEGSLGMLPRRIVVDEEHLESARQLLEDAGLAHELRPRQGGPQPDTTDDAVLGGRLRLKQKKRGHRVGHDAILLAAATAARSGDRVVEFGAGVGAAGLALAVRCQEVEVTLVEIDPELSGIAAENIARNGLAERVRAVALDVTASADEFAAHDIGPGSADRVLMNPPFNDPARQNVSPDPARRAAHAAGEGLLAAWVDAADAGASFRGNFDVDLARRRPGGGSGRAGRPVRRHRRAAGSRPRGAARHPRPGARAKGQPRAVRAAAGLDVERRDGKAHGGGGSGAARGARRCRWLTIKQQTPQGRGGWAVE